LTDWSDVAIPDFPEKLGLAYVAGPMSNIGPPTWNYPAFEDLTSRLRAAGRKVIGPHELHEPSSKVAWDWYLRRDLAQLVKCSDIFLLPGWGASKGATLEHHVGKTLGMTVHYPGDSID
jgi:Domain of unknown function (DUF4406)